MALNPAMQALRESGIARYERRTTGIIPIDTDVPIDDREVCIAGIAVMISEAVIGPPVSAYDLAEQIVDEVCERLLSD